MTKNKNKVYLEGMLEEDGKYSHEVASERFYTGFLRVERLSGAADVLPFMVSERIIPLEQLKRGAEFGFWGSFRSRNEIKDGKSRLKLSVFVDNVVKKDGNSNRIELKGYVVKQPNYRSTPLGREVCDLLIACNLVTGKTDYLPCITWGRNARFSKRINVGDCVTLKGRIQSRGYNKALESGIVELKTAYEVSVSSIQINKQKGVV